MLPNIKIFISFVLLSGFFSISAAGQKESAFPMDDSFFGTQRPKDLTSFQSQTPSEQTMNSMYNQLPFFSKEEEPVESGVKFRSNPGGDPWVEDAPIDDIPLLFFGLIILLYVAFAARKQKKEQQRDKDKKCKLSKSYKLRNTE